MPRSPIIYGVMAHCVFLLLLTSVLSWLSIAYESAWLAMVVDYLSQWVIFSGYGAAGAYIIASDTALTHWRQAWQLPVMRVWMVGMAVIVVCYVLVLSPSLRLNVGYVITGVALTFWLMRRFGNVAQAWADAGVVYVAAFMTIAGLCLSFPGLAIFAPFVVPLCWANFAAHSYRALSDTTPSRTLSAHWMALALIVWLLGLVLVGALIALPDIRDMAQATILPYVQRSLIHTGAWALILAVINQAVAEMRRQNQRITGLLPYWCVLFGTLGYHLALGVMGVVQIYFGLLDVVPQQADMLLQPLHLLAIIAHTGLTFGFLFYAMGFYARRLR